MSDDLAPILRDFLAGVSTLGLATVDAEGRPHAANVNFVSDEALNLYWLSHPESAHSRHIAERSAVAATAHGLFSDPSEIRGVQLHGEAKAVPSGEFERLWTLFCDKFPYAAGFEKRARSERFYRLRPTWVRWIDNRVRFGHKIEADWSADGSG